MLNKTAKKMMALVASLCCASALITSCGGKGSDTTAQETTSATTTTSTTSPTAAETSTSETTTETTESSTETTTEETTTEETTTEETTTEETTTTEAAQQRTVSITHPFETAEYPVNPKRVVALGQVAVDNLLSLGIKPVMIMGMAREKNIPWETAIMGDNIPFVQISNFMDPKAELIASYKPDLIVGDVWGVTDETYAKLKVIAPTIGPASYEPEEIGWIEQLRNLGKIFNKEAEAEKVISDDRALFAQAAKEMPGLQGKSGIASQYIGSMKSFGVISQPMIPASQFFIQLGMHIPEAIVKAPNQMVGRATISAENISMLNADFALFAPRGATVEEIREVPGFNDLKEVKTGAYKIVAQEYLLQAINQPSALSRAYALRELRPVLEIAAAN